MRINPNGEEKTCKGFVSLFLYKDGTCEVGTPKHCRENVFRLKHCGALHYGYGGGDLFCTILLEAVPGVAVSVFKFSNYISFDSLIDRLYKIKYYLKMYM